MVSADDIAFINERADVVLGACSPTGAPSVCWAMGGHAARAAAGGAARITVWVQRAQATQLLADVRATGRVAATFTEPLSARSRQFKGSDARVRDARHADAATLARHLDNLVREIGKVGYPERFVRAVFEAPLRELVAVEFTPDDAYDQTPGANAGQRVGQAASPAPAQVPAPAAASAPNPTWVPGLGDDTHGDAPGMNPGMSLSLMRDALEGVIPGILATCDPQGVPNVAFLSQVHYVDDAHVALSWQFFNKTRRNILAHPHGQLTVMDPRTGRMYRMRLRYLRTESEGALFERMRAHLEGIASHTGMAGVFRLLGSDVYRVSALEALSGNTYAAPAPPRPLLAALRRSSEALQQCADFASLVDTTLDSVVREFGHRHAMLLMLDSDQQRLYTVGTRGYPASGVGSEVMVGDGVIGECARSRTTIRVTWLTQAYLYQQRLRDSVIDDGRGHMLRTEIPYPGLAEPQSQLGVPVLAGSRLLGVLFVESPQPISIRYDDEDALGVLATQLGLQIHALHEADEAPRGAGSTEVAAQAVPISAASAAISGAPAAGAMPVGLPSVQARPLRVRRFAGSDSIFLDDQYLIKGVAGAIFWRLASEYATTGRTAFSNRELREDPRIRLPEVTDNLEARLILLRRRLAEQDMGVQLLRTGRGLLSLQVSRPLLLSETG